MIKMAILGIDEVGRGPWAGPLVVGAVVLSGGMVDGLTDSKKLTARKREELAEKVRESGAGVGLGWVSAEEIDEVGLSEALRLATRRAVEEISAAYDEVIIDGTVNFLAETILQRNVTVLAKADLLIAEVSAASIVAKVARDEYMAQLAEKYPEYGFERHVGYGTAAHREALCKYGATPEHRKSFRPVAEMLENSDRLPSGALSRARLSSQGAGAAVRLEIGASGPLPSPHGFAVGAPTSTAARVAKVCSFRKNTTLIGQRAEGAVAEYLRKRGHEIVARNWKTRFCEIDIVSRKGDTVYFTEVKYRRDVGHGSGLLAITQDKQRKMKFAAESYIKFSELDLTPVLAVAEVSGEEFAVGEWFLLDS